MLEVEPRDGMDVSLLAVVFAETSTGQYLARCCGLSPRSWMMTLVWMVWCMPLCVGSLTGLCGVGVVRALTVR